MSLIKTDRQNYTNIADAIREVVGGSAMTLMDDSITTENGEVFFFLADYKMETDSFTEGSSFIVECDEISYACPLSYSYTQETTCIGNVSIFAEAMITALKTTSGKTREEVLAVNPDLKKDTVDTGEPFCIFIQSQYKRIDIYTREAKTYHFVIKKLENCKIYKPEEMAPALDVYFPDYGVSYDTLSGNGENPITASTYGYKAVGFAENSALSSVNISDKTREIGDYAFHYCSQLSISTLPEGVEIIGRSAFYRCNAITSFTFPKSIKKIGGSAFDYCSRLKTVTFKGTPDEIASTAFSMNSGITFNVPWSEGEVAGYPWGASNSTINYNYTG